MKNERGFWGGLEKYLRRVLERSTLPYYWRHIGIGLVLVVVVTSIVNVKNSTAGATNIEAVVQIATQRGDYATARKWWSESMVQLEDKVYPERKVERRIRELEEKLVEYPENMEIYLALSNLYGQLGNLEQASEYWEKARVLDPNNEMFR